MPLYEYACHQCGTHFDRLQKFSDQPLKVHEGCGGEVERLISAPALQFKGTGWYITDYARKNSAPTANGASEKSESKSDTKNGSSGESKSDSKGDSKTESKSESKSETKSESKTESKPAPSAPAAP
jgi:putative FmdB family regulatory protein